MSAMQLSKRMYFLLFSLILGISSFLSYYGVLIHHFPIAPGDDIQVHLANIVAITQHGLPRFGSGYPPGLYILIILFSKFLHINVLQGLTYLAPALLPLSG